MERRVGGEKRERDGGGGKTQTDRQGQTDYVCHICSVHMEITSCIIVWCAQNVRLDGSRFTQHHAAM